MADNERVVVLMSPAEKAALDAKARRAGSITLGEFIRRVVEAYDDATEAEAAELRTLLPVLADTHEATLRQLRQTEQKLDDTNRIVCAVLP